MKCDQNWDKSVSRMDSAGASERVCVVMVGAFPPPIHGMAVINKAVAECFIEAERSVEIVDLAAPSLARGLHYHLVRIGRVVRGIARVLTLSSGGRQTMYMNVSGGAGQLYETIFALLARAKRWPLTLHHHTYAYLGRRRWLTRLLFAAAPGNTRHVALSPGMAYKLQDFYSIKQPLVLSNAAFLSLPSVAPPAKPLATLGFLSNISQEKGIFDFFALVEACQKHGLEVSGVIAGPFQDSETESSVMSMLQSRTGIRYVGPKYGEAKATFLESLDVLAFPTRYANEAEPVTVLEAMRVGIPVVAYSRGAISDMLDRDSGCLVAPEEDFARCAISAISVWCRDPALFMRTRINAQHRFLSHRSAALTSLRVLLNGL